MSPIIKCCMALMTRRSENKRTVNGSVHTFLSLCIDLCIMHWFLQGLNQAFQEFLNAIIKQQLGAFCIIIKIIIKILISFPHIASMDSCSCLPFKRLVYFPWCHSDQVPCYGHFQIQYIRVGGLRRVWAVQASHDNWQISASSCNVASQAKSDWLVSAQQHWKKARPSGNTEVVIFQI